MNTEINPVVVSELSYTFAVFSPSPKSQRFAEAVLQDNFPDRWLFEPMGPHWFRIGISTTAEKGPLAGVIVERIQLNGYAAEVEASEDDSGEPEPYQRALIFSPPLGTWLPLGSKTPYYELSSF